MTCQVANIVEAGRQSLATSGTGLGASSVPALVSAQAAMRPEALAVAGGGRRLSYRELEARAGLLARRLRALRVARGAVVGLCLESSPEMVVGALGILQAGAAYLPLAAGSPPSRLAALLRDAGAAALVTVDCLSARVPEGGWRTVTIDLDSPAETAREGEEPAAKVAPDDLASVIYTSGSTGQPKGVEITHGGLMNLVRWHQAAFAVTPADRATQIANVGFDAAVWELWPYLTAGASVHVPAASARQQPDALRDWLVSEGITLTFVPTPMAERMMALPWPAAVPLRAMLTGGDVLHRHPPAGLPFRLVNNYGPTECTVVATSGEVRAEDASDERPTIGRPIDNTEVLILDERLQPVPPGTPGELHLGGAGLARGYLKRPDLTAERFISHPVRAGERLYKTGDLAQLCPDGQIAFLGRTDAQIKVRGHRIEPAEVVTALDRHPAVRESAVAGREVAPGDTRLVAYVVLVEGPRPDHAALRDFLGAHLPDYMVPATFVALDELPLVANGKVDRASLPAPDPGTTIGEEEFVAPRTPLEERIAEILADLLHLERVGVLDNFFMLGGHSLLGTQLIARLREVFGVEMELRTLFDRPTVAGLGGEVERLLMEKLEAMGEEEVERRLRAAPTGSPSST